MEIDLKKFLIKNILQLRKSQKLWGAKAHTLRYWEREFDSLFKLKKLSNKKEFLKKRMLLTY